MYRIVVHRRATRYLQNLPSPEKERIKEALAQLAADPFAYPGVKAMAGQWNGWFRIRLGDKRILLDGSKRYGGLCRSYRAARRCLQVIDG